ncbi:MAG TPA: hypothetical protein VI072_14530 [Polyangiaceae bacterium]
MLSHRSRAFASSLAVSVLTLASSASAQPSTCDTDATCERGYRCDVIGFVDCRVAPCPPGEKCPVLEDDCVELKACVPGAACNSDADCGSEMVCYEHTRTSCSGGARPEPCPVGAECEEPILVPPECEESKEKGCVPKYAAPCGTDTDCGSGFRCVEQQSCGCGGSPGRDAPPPTDTGAGGSADDSTLPEDCSCEPSGTFHCESLVDVCSKDDDCPADFTCVDHGIVTSCASPEPTRAGDPEDLPVCDAEPVVTHDYRCTAPAFSGYGGPTRGAVDDFGDGEEGAEPRAPAGSNDGGGCAVSRGRGVSSNGFVFAGLGALVLLASRFRRRARA